MYVLSDQARLVDVAPRKIRLQMLNGGVHLQQSAVYRITSSGIEYLTMMQKVVDTESTVTANITRAIGNQTALTIRHQRTQR